MHSNPSLKEPLDNNLVPVYKKQEEALSRDRQKLRIFNEQQEDSFVPLVIPTIYAFSSPELDKRNPGLVSVKVGDTHQSDYTARLNQWGKEYGEITEICHMGAFFDIKDKNGFIERVYFRDYAIHRILEECFEQDRLLNTTFSKPENFNSVSQEFFVPKNNSKPVSLKILNSAKEIIKEDYENATNLYTTYKQPPLSVRDKNVSYIKEKPDEFIPYKYQKEAALSLTDKFLSPVKDSHKNDSRKVILDAPTRSGKSYMICWALKAIIQKINKTYQNPDSVFSQQGSQDGEEGTFTVITTGFPDVFDEFQKTVEKHKDFRKFFCWITKDQLLLNSGIIKEKHESGYKHVVMALSLQDLAGRSNNNNDSEDLKEIHKRIRGKVDFVIGDECHFAMFSEAEAYKAALKEADEIVALDDEESKDIEKELENGHKARFTLSPRYGYLFASATTYSVLDRNVFDRNKDIVFVSPYDIQSETDKINKQYAEEPLGSPFFGRPKKHYSDIDLGCQASELFRADKSGEFVHKEAVRAVVESFYGINSYENLPALFSNDILKSAGAGRHMLWQMPSKNACDALEELFRKLNINKDYYLLNISSKKRNSWSGASVYKIKDEIHRRRFEKTITITVARFVTGVSVPEWDSVILANSGQSLTRRIQTYGRVETPWVENIVNEKQEQTKYCQKPNCFVFDLNPEQLYEFYNQVELHDSRLGGSSKERSEVVPGGNAFSFNGLTMKTVTLKDVHKQLEEYTKRRKVGELTARIDPIGEMEINSDLREIIQIAGAGKKVKIQLNELDEEIAEREFPDLESDEDESSKEKLSELELKDVIDDFRSSENPDEKELKKIASDDKKRREFIYKKIILASILTEESSPMKLLKLLQENKEHRRLANNIGLSESMLGALTQACGNFNVVDRLERSMKAIIARVKGRSYEGISETEEADAFLLIISELEALSENQIITPPATAEKMVDALHLNFNKVVELLNNDNPDFIDIGAKSGVLLVTTYSRIIKIINEAIQADLITEERAEEIKRETGKNLIAIPTSSISYEIIKKLYALMQWSSNNIWWCEEASSDVKENWAYFIAINTEDLIGFANLEKKQQRAEMRKWAKESKLLANLIKKEQDIFLDFLIRLANIMNEKFDYAISNPPYQVVGSEKNIKSFPIYPGFIDSARLFSETVIMIHPARFLSNAGETNKSWNKSIIESPEFSVLELYHDSEDIFPSVSIAGGVAITSFRKNKTDGGYKGVYISNDNLASVKNKIWRDANQISLMSYVSVRSPFRYKDKSFTGRTDIQPNAFLKTKKIFNREAEIDSLKVIGLDSEKHRVERYIKRTNIVENPLIESYKIFIPKAAGSGDFGSVLSAPLIAKPSTICTETFISIGPLQDNDEANALLKYIKSKFARTMLGLLKVTQDNPRRVWEYIPWQDFSKKSDIDWSKSIKEIDQQLYKKYGLNKEEIEFIEENVREME